MKNSFFFPLLFIFLGCGDCYSILHYKSELRSENSEILNLSICRKNSPGIIKTITVSAGIPTSIEWKSSKIYNRTDLSSTCHDRHDEDEFVPILLTASMQTSVRLCLYSDNTYLINPISTPCENDSQEVTDHCLGS